jgi:hypothetical protein
MQVISLGWGVQSFALAAMSALGDLPPVDVALHADTGHERSETYKFAKKWTPWLEDHGVKVVTVKGGRPIIGTKAPSYTSIPAFASYDDGRPSGMLRRQCTYDWKIAPMRRWLQKHRRKKVVHQWIGITLDEVQRLSQADVKYQQNRYPFIEDLDRPWTRHMVMRWLKENDLEIPVKSACVFCPFHDRATWREIKVHSALDWSKAVRVDADIRDRRPGYVCYLIKARVPLHQYDFSNDQDHGQTTLWDEHDPGIDFL